MAPSRTKKVRIGNAFLGRGGLGVVFVGLFNHFQGNLSFTRIAEFCSYIDNKIQKIGFLPNIKCQIKNFACRVFPCHASAKYKVAAIKKMTVSVISKIMLG